MDVNGTRFHLLFGPGDWKALLAQDSPHRGLEWHPATASVRLNEDLFRFPASAGDRRLSPADRRGTARDRFGNWYWISADRAEVRVRFRGGSGPAHFWTDGDVTAACAPTARTDFKAAIPPRSPEPRRMAGLAVTQDHRLVVGLTGDTPAFLAFDLHAGGPPTEWRWPAGWPFHPVDMAAAPTGGLWILDQGAEAASPAESRLWFLDRHLRVCHPTSQPSPATPAEDADFTPTSLTASGDCPPPGLPPEDRLAAAAIAVAGQPVALEVLPDGSLLLLEPQTDETVLRHFRPCKGTEDVVCLDDRIADSLPEQSPGFVLAGHDLAFQPEGQIEAGRFQGLLFVVGREGNQAFAFELEGNADRIELKLHKKYYPVRLFSGRGLTFAGQNVWYDQGESWRSLYAQPQPRYAREGTLETGVFDGHDPDCVWHRLALDGCIPPRSSVEVRCRAANHKDWLEQMDWESQELLQPVPYPRPRSEIPWHVDSSDAGTWELLFQGVRGRYLQIRLKLTGTGRNTPRLRALRAWYPRFSYLKEYLPACYRDDTASADFLDRFLANPEGIFTDLEGRIERAQVLFDAQAVHLDYLPWLAGWLGVVFQEDWSEQKKRFFLAHAVEFFRMRGTPRGVQVALRLALEECVDPRLFEPDSACAYHAGSGCPSHAIFGIRLVESFLRRRVPGVVLGAASAATDASGLPSRSVASAAEIHADYRKFLQQRYPTDPTDPAASLDALRRAWHDPNVTFETVLFSPVQPARAGQAADWDAFRRQGLGFTYAVVTGRDETFYQEFLQRKYRQVRRLREAWQWTELTSFEAVTLPGEDAFPDGGHRLEDWLQFVSQVVPLRDHAHRLEVLLPVRPDEATDKVLARGDLARHVLSLEQPAHVQTEVRFYWAALRVGEARLGWDTLLDRGSRWFAVLLGQSYLAEGFLGTGHPWNVTDRMVLDRDVVSRRPAPNRPVEEHS